MIKADPRSHPCPYLRRYVPHNCRTGARKVTPKDLMVLRGRCSSLQGAEPHRHSRQSRSIVVQDRADTAILGEQRIAAVAEQVQVERLVGLLLAVAVDGNRDRLG